MNRILYTAYTRLRLRLEPLRKQPDRGNHATEYAIGIGAGAVVMALLARAYRDEVTSIINGWTSK